MFDDFEVYVQSDEFATEYEEWLAILEEAQEESNENGLIF